MGYSTYFNLTWKLCDLETGKLSELPGVFVIPLRDRLIELSEYGWWEEFDVFGSKLPDANWYDWQVHMTQLSSEYPNIYFELHGDGEESDDFWKCFFLNGKMSGGDAELVYPEFDFEEHMSSE